MDFTPLKTRSAKSLLCVTIFAVDTHRTSHVCITCQVPPHSSKRGDEQLLYDDSESVRGPELQPFAPPELQLGKLDASF